MLAKQMCGDPWSQTLFLLDALSKAGKAGRQPAGRGQARPRLRPLDDEEGPKGEANIRVLDRPTSRTAIVTWGDPTSCHYGDQVWRVARAARDGFCALSGQQIHRGDAVYRPSHYRPAPANAGSMMLAQCVLVAPIDH
jgi:hypothetical protein